MLFRYIGGGHTHLAGDEDIFVHPFTGERRLCSRTLTKAASLCTPMALLAEHSERLSRLLQQPLEVCERIVQASVQEGLLCSAQDLHRRFTGNLRCASQSHHIERVAIATRDRPAMLRRLLTSLSEHLQRWGRQAIACVVDDSRSDASQVANQHVIRLFGNSAHLTVQYGDRRARAVFADALAARGALDPGLVRFALLGDDRFSISVGAARNALLLECAGSDVLFLDDDVQCAWAKIPGSVDRVVLSRSAFTGSFLTDISEIAAYALADEDLFAWHERALSINAQSLTQVPCTDFGDFSSVLGRFLPQSDKCAGFVAMSMAGLLGDVAMDDPLPYFTQGMATLQALPRTPARYNRALSSRAMIRGSAGLLLSDSADCMSFCLSLASAEFLPPFAPVFRAEEQVFGTLVSRCFRNALFATIPRAALHCPDLPRSFSTDPQTWNAGRFGANEILAALISAGPIGGRSAVHRFRTLIEDLYENACADRQSFCKTIREALAPGLVAQLRNLKSALDAGAPGELWRDAVEHIYADCVAALAYPADVAAVDLNSDDQTPFDTFRAHVQKFARLGLAWGGILDISRQLHKERVSMFRTI